MVESFNQTSLAELDKPNIDVDLVKERIDRLTREVNDRFKIMSRALMMKVAPLLVATSAILTPASAAFAQEGTTTPSPIVIPNVQGKEVSRNAEVKIISSEETNEEDISKESLMKIESILNAMVGIHFDVNNTDYRFTGTGGIYIQPDGKLYLLTADHVINPSEIKFSQVQSDFPDISWLDFKEAEVKVTLRNGQEYILGVTRNWSNTPQHEFDDKTGDKGISYHEITNPDLLVEIQSQIEEGRLTPLVIEHLDQVHQGDEFVIFRRDIEAEKAKRVVIAQGYNYDNDPITAEPDGGNLFTVTLEDSKGDAVVCPGQSGGPAVYSYQDEKGNVIPTNRVGGLIVYIPHDEREPDSLGLSPNTCSAKLHIRPIPGGLTDEAGNRVTAFTFTIHESNVPSQVTSSAD